MKWLLLIAFFVCGLAQTQTCATNPRLCRLVDPTPIYAGGEYFPKLPPPSSYIHTRSTSQVANKGVIKLGANCEAGEVLLGGGYSFGPSAGIGVISNYPSSETTWTNEFHVRSNDGESSGGVLPPFHATLTTFAYCMDAPDAGVTVQTVVQDNAGLGNSTVTGPGALSAVQQSWSVLCPAGSVLTGGGFAVDGPLDDQHDIQYNTDILASQPLVGADKRALGWHLSLVAFQAGKIRPTRAYARCALSGLKPAQAGENNANLTTAPVAIGDFEVTSTCPVGALTTGGGHAHAGDWLIAHWVSVTRASDPDLRSWTARSFGGYQTPNYDFRPCAPVTAQCLSASVIAACFQTPDIDYVNVRITSPPSGYHFDVERIGAANTPRIAFTAEVRDKLGNLVPTAIVRWTSTPGSGASAGGKAAEVLGYGRRLNTALGAGATLNDVTIGAYAVVPRYKKTPLIAQDSIVLNVGTVP